MVQIRVAPNTGDETVFDPDTIAMADFAKTHTGLSDYQIDAQRNLGWHDFALDELWLEDDDGTLLFRGLLEAIDEKEGQDVTPTATLSGHGPGYRLETSETVFVVQNELMHNAIDRFWTNETSFSPVTVTQPSINNTVTGETAQEANTTSEFESITDIADTDPITISGDEVKLQQTCFVVEAEDYDRATGNTLNANDGDFSGGDANVFSSNDVTYEWDFTPVHDIPEGEFEIFYRNDADDSNGAPPNVNWYLNDEFIGSTNEFLSLSWDGVYDVTGETAPRLEAGETYTIGAENALNGFGGVRNIDVVAPLDDRYNYTFDNSNDGAGGYLDGPEFFPDAVDFTFDLATTSWNVTDGTLTTTWDDTTNGQRIQLRLTDQTYFPNDGTEDNTTSITTDFGSEVGSAIQGRATFSRYGSNAGQTPLTGVNGQSLQSWEITFDGNDIPVFSGSETFEGSQLEVAQQMHQRANMRFTLEHSKTDLPVESYRPEDNVKSLPTLTKRSETTRTDLGEYFNKVTVKGQRNDDGNRPSHTVSDQDAINDDGERVFNVLDPSLDSLEAIKVAARSTLLEKLRERDDKGEMEVAPIDIAPGFGRTSPFGGTDTPIEEVSYQISNGDVSGRLTFDYRTGARLASDIGGLRKGTRDAKLGF